MPDAEPGDYEGYDEWLDRLEAMPWDETLDMAWPQVDHAGVECVDGHINGSREHVIANEDTLVATISVQAAFVGEAVIRTYGGR